MTIETSIELITPERAAEFLENHPRNRRLSEKRVATLASYMQRGLWHFDGDPIRIGQHGELLDGQHRLEAVIKANMAQEFLVIRGLKPDSQLVMNTGKARTLVDQLDMLGEKDTSTLGALLVMAQMWHAGRRGRQVFAGAAGASTPAFEESIHFLQSDSEDLRSAAANGKRVSRKFRIVPRVFSISWYVFSKIDSTDAEFFFSRLVDGLDLEEKDPIRILREKLIQLGNVRSGRGGYDPAYFLALVIKSWNAYRRGQEMSVLNWRAGGSNPETFPEPR